MSELAFGTKFTILPNVQLLSHVNKTQDPLIWELELPGNASFRIRIKGEFLKFNEGTPEETTYFNILESKTPADIESYARLCTKSLHDIFLNFFMNYEYSINQLRQAARIKTIETNMKLSTLSGNVTTADAIIGKEYLIEMKFTTASFNFTEKVKEVRATKYEFCRDNGLVLIPIVYTLESEIIEALAGSGSPIIKALINDDSKLRTAGIIKPTLHEKKTADARLTEFFLQNPQFLKSEYCQKMNKYDPVKHNFYNEYSDLLYDCVQEVPRYLDITLNSVLMTRYLSDRLPTPQEVDLRALDRNPNLVSLSEAYKREGKQPLVVTFPCFKGNLEFPDNYGTFLAQALKHGKIFNGVEFVYKESELCSPLKREHVNTMYNMMEIQDDYLKMEKEIRDLQRDIAFLRNSSDKETAKEKGRKYGINLLDYKLSKYGYADPLIKLLNNKLKSLQRVDNPCKFSKRGTMKIMPNKSNKWNDTLRYFGINKGKEIGSERLKEELKDFHLNIEAKYGASHSSSSDVLNVFEQTREVLEVGDNKREEDEDDLMPFQEGDIISSFDEEVDHYIEKNRRRILEEQNDKSFEYGRTMYYGYVDLVTLIDDKSILKLIEIFMVNHLKGMDDSEIYGFLIEKISESIFPYPFTRDNFVLDPEEWDEEVFTIFNKQLQLLKVIDLGTLISGKGHLKKLAELVKDELTYIFLLYLYHCSNISPIILENINKKNKEAVEKRMQFISTDIAESIIDIDVDKYIGEVGPSRFRHPIPNQEQMGNIMINEALHHLRIEANRPVNRFNSYILHHANDWVSQFERVVVKSSKPNEVLIVRNLEKDVISIMGVPAGYLSTGPETNITYVKIPKSIEERRKLIAFRVKDDWKSGARIIIEHDGYYFFFSKPVRHSRMVFLSQINYTAGLLSLGGLCESQEFNLLDSNIFQMLFYTQKRQYEMVGAILYLFYKQIDAVCSMGYWEILDKLATYSFTCPLTGYIYWRLKHKFTEMHRSYGSVIINKQFKRFETPIEDAVFPGVFHTTKLHEKIIAYIKQLFPKDNFSAKLIVNQAFTKIEEYAQQWKDSFCSHPGYIYKKTSVKEFNDLVFGKRKESGDANRPYEIKAEKISYLNSACYLACKDMVKGIERTTNLNSTILQRTDKFAIDETKNSSVLVAGPNPNDPSLKPFIYPEFKEGNFNIDPSQYSYLNELVKDLSKDLGDTESAAESVRELIANLETHYSRLAQSNPNIPNINETLGYIHSLRPYLAERFKDNSSASISKRPYPNVLSTSLKDATYFATFAYNKSHPSTPDPDILDLTTFLMMLYPMYITCILHDKIEVGYDKRGFFIQTENGRHMNLIKENTIRPLTWKLEGQLILRPELEKLVYLENLYSKVVQKSKFVTFIIIDHSKWGENTPTEVSSITSRALFDSGHFSQAVYDYNIVTDMMLHERKVIVPEVRRIYLEKFMKESVTSDEQFEQKFSVIVEGMGKEERKYRTIEAVKHLTKAFEDRPHVAEILRSYEKLDFGDEANVALLHPTYMAHTVSQKVGFILGGINVFSTFWACYTTKAINDVCNSCFENIDITGHNQSDDALSFFTAAMARESDISSSEFTKVLDFDNVNASQRGLLEMEYNELEMLNQQLEEVSDKANKERRFLEESDSDKDKPELLPGNIKDNTQKKLPEANKINQSVIGDFLLVDDNGNITYDSRPLNPNDNNDYRNNPLNRVPDLPRLRESKAETQVEIAKSNQNTTFTEFLTSQIYQGQLGKVDVPYSPSVSPNRGKGNRYAALGNISLSDDIIKRNAGVDVTQLSILEGGKDSSFYMDLERDLISAINDLKNKIEYMEDQLNYVEVTKKEQLLILARRIASGEKYELVEEDHKQICRNKTLHSEIYPASMASWIVFSISWCMRRMFGCRGSPLKYVMSSYGEILQLSFVEGKALIPLLRFVQIVINEPSSMSYADSIRSCSAKVLSCFTAGTDQFLFAYQQIIAWWGCKALWGHPKVYDPNELDILGGVPFFTLQDYALVGPACNQARLMLLSEENSEFGRRLKAKLYLSLAVSPIWKKSKTTEDEHTDTSDPMQAGVNTGGNGEFNVYRVDVHIFGTDRQQAKEHLQKFIHGLSSVDMQFRIQIANRGEKEYSEVLNDYLMSKYHLHLLNKGDVNTKAAGHMTTMLTASYASMRFFKRAGQTARVRGMLGSLSRRMKNRFMGENLPNDISYLEHLEYFKFICSSWNDYSDKITTQLFKIERDSYSHTMQKISQSTEIINCKGQSYNYYMDGFWEESVQKVRMLTKTGFNQDLVKVAAALYYERLLHIKGLKQGEFYIETSEVAAICNHTISNIEFKVVFDSIISDLDPLEIPINKMQLVLNTMIAIKSADFVEVYMKMPVNAPSINGALNNKRSVKLGFYTRLSFGGTFEMRAPKNKIYDQGGQLALRTSYIGLITRTDQYGVPTVDGTKWMNLNWDVHFDRLKFNSTKVEANTYLVSILHANRAGRYDFDFIRGKINFDFVGTFKGHKYIRDKEIIPSMVIGCKLKDIYLIIVIPYLRQDNIDEFLLDDVRYYTNEKRPVYLYALWNFCMHFLLPAQFKSMNPFHSGFKGNLTGIIGQNSPSDYPYLDKLEGRINDIALPIVFFEVDHRSFIAWNQVSHYVYGRKLTATNRSTSFTKTVQQAGGRTYSIRPWILNNETGIQFRHSLNESVNFLDSTPVPKPVLYIMLCRLIPWIREYNITISGPGSITEVYLHGMNLESYRFVLLLIVILPLYITTLNEFHISLINSRSDQQASNFLMSKKIYKIVQDFSYSLSGLEGIANRSFSINRNQLESFIIGTTDDLFRVDRGQEENAKTLLWDLACFFTRSSMYLDIEAPATMESNIIDKNYDFQTDIESDPDVKAEYEDMLNDIVEITEKNEEVSLINLNGFLEKGLLYHGWIVYRPDTMFKLGLYKKDLSISLMRILADLERDPRFRFPICFFGSVHRSISLIFKELCDKIPVAMSERAGDKISRIFVPLIKNLVESSSVYRSIRFNQAVDGLDPVDRRTVNLSQATETVPQMVADGGNLSIIDEEDDFLDTDD